MTTVEVAYLVGVPVAAVLAATNAEIERRASCDPFKRQAVLAPGLDGLVVGVCWPLLAAGAVAVGVVALIALAGRIGARVWR